MGALQQITLGLGGSAPPPAGNPWLLGTTTGTLRNNLDWWVGCRLDGGAVDTTVTHLGHIWLTGNSGTRTVVIYVPGGALVATAVVDMSAGVNDEYNYTAITPVVLTAGAPYNLSSLEVNGGNQWRDLANAPAQSSAAVLFSAAAHATDPANLTLFDLGKLYGPVNFKAL